MVPGCCFAACVLACLASGRARQWVLRPAMSSDNYHVMLACRSTGNRSYFEVGYTASFHLSYSPQNCSDYWWLVIVTPQGLIFGGTGGASYETRAVSFSNTGN